MMMSAMGPSARQELRVFSVRHVDYPNSLEPVLPRFTGARLKADNATRSLFVRGTAEEIERVATILKALDVPDGRVTTQIDGMHVFERVNADRDRILKIAESLGLSLANRLSRLEGGTTVVFGASPEEIEAVKTIVRTLDSQKQTFERATSPDGASPESRERDRFPRK
jgi:type II secretory pathway component GspD/PulD (secretin)